jgi:hypothetical protein
MKHETNNEMDLLLRRLSRRQDAFTSDADHLDADELSAYAENALPNAARARYTEHLAECSQCRKLIVQLSSAGGFAPVAETAKDLQPSGLRNFLASLLSPMVLRYAVPALGLVVVAAIGFFVLRQRAPSGEFVSQVQQQPAAASPVASPEQGVAAYSDRPAPGLLDTRDNQQSRGVTTQPERETRAKETDAPPPPPNAAPAITGVRTEIKPQEAPAAKTESVTVANSAPSQPAPKPTPETAVDESKADTGERRQTTQGRAAAAPGSAIAKQTAATDSIKTENERGDLAAMSAGSSAKRIQRDGTENKDEAETRSVAGRRFRKQRGVWVDTAYESGATTNLRRGSEQYRALIADEPAIKSIADQLDGEIIVVWKGRPYKIR